MRRSEACLAIILFLFAFDLVACGDNGSNNLIVLPRTPTPRATSTPSPTGTPVPATATPTIKPTATITATAPSPTATSTGAPVASGSLAVTDFGGAVNRVLLFTPPFSIGMNASFVIGASSFTMGGSGLSASQFLEPGGLSFDSSSDLWVTDRGNNRVLEFKPAFSNGMDASLVIGQPDFTSSSLGTAQNSLRLPNDAAIDPHGNLWVADTQNFRVLEFKPPFTNGMNASVVIGQDDFSSRVSGVVAQNRLVPFVVAFDAGGDLWIADTSANRVLEFVPPFSNGMNASLVIGQDNFTSSARGTDSSSMSNPDGLTFDKSGSLWVGDESNCRILRFSAPFSTGQGADLVLGQPDFTSSTCGVAANMVDDALPALASDATGRVWVGDDFHSRVLGFDPPFGSGQDASVVIGQSSFTSETPALTQNGLTGVTGLAVSP
jgi:sugar lactone lactonase YvrE